MIGMRTKIGKKMEADLKKLNCTITYFPYTDGVSSTLINSALNDLRSK